MVPNCAIVSAVVALLAACSSAAQPAGTKAAADVAGPDDAADSDASAADAPAGDASSTSDVAAGDVADAAVDAVAAVADATATVDATVSVDAAVTDAGVVVDGAPAMDAVQAADAASAVDGDSTAADAAANAPQECPDRAKMVYIVSNGDELLQFDPDGLATKLIGKLACPGALGSPFSMGVDRWATAWVLYNGGQLFQVSTLNGACQATAFQPNQQNFDVFGMAFSADAPGALTEQLYVAGGGTGGFNGGPNKLATIDLKSFLLKPLAKLNPVATGVDLSGNGNGELWGFFTSTKPPSVRQIDKVTATTISVMPLNGSDFAAISSWAFASWGGDFYLFSRNGQQPSTVVHRLDPSGNATKVIPALGYTIVGAGVSSCAPTKPAP